VKGERRMKITKMVTENPVSVKIILSALWAARMLSGLQGDSTRFHDPVALNELVAGSSDVPVTVGLLLVMSIIFAVSILMTVLSLTLVDRVNRWANRCIGIFFVLFDLIFLGLALFVWPFSSYEVLWSVMYLVFTSLVVWYAWKWPEQGA
jgi:hypothetical protein